MATPPNSTTDADGVKRGCSTRTPSVYATNLIVTTRVAAAMSNPSRVLFTCSIEVITRSSTTWMLSNAAAIVSGCERSRASREWR